MLTERITRASAPFVHNRASCDTCGFTGDDYGDALCHASWNQGHTVEWVTTHRIEIFCTSRGSEVGHGH